MDLGYKFELESIETPSGAILMVVGNNCRYHLSSLHHQFFCSHCFKAINIQTHSSNSYLETNYLLILHTPLAIPSQSKIFAKN